MRLVSISNVEPGMVVGKDIYDEYGRTLIGHGCALTTEYIEKLDARGFSGVYVDDDLSKDIFIEEAISERMRQEGMKCVQNGDIEGCMRVAQRIVEELLNKSEISFDMVDLRSYDNYTYAHSVNVAVLSGAIGLGLRLDAEQHYFLVLAALLHDLGKMMIPEQMLNKPGRLSKEEFEIMKTHAELSYNLLSQRWDISGYVKTAVLFHHENYDGTGYPQGLVGDEIPLLARILHVADVYDALISKRPYKNPYSPNEAAEYLMGASGVLFDPKIVETLLKFVPLYQKGQEVILSDGRTGVVCENNGYNNLRPVVMLLDGMKIDLADKNYYNITILGTEGNVQKPDEDEEQHRKENMERVERRTIMVVDDMKTNLQLLRSILEMDYELVLLRSGKQAIDYIDNNPFPDLIIMDIDMPEMDGIETVRQINTRTKNYIPILFVTALADKETVMECKSLDPAGYIIRPYKPVFVKSEIDRILNGWSI